MSLLFLLAYACSGLAGLVYEVSWTRLLTLHIGHTTAAASAVVAAFLGGLAVGAAGGGVVAARLRPLQSLQAYVGLELLVALFALLLPLELRALTPLLRWAYTDAAPGLLFPAIRLTSCLAMVFLPAAALGATFPMAVRWFAHRSDNPARASSVLYAINTVGAAVGSLLAGFTLIPSIGISGTTTIGMLASGVAAVLVTIVVMKERRNDTAREPYDTTARLKPGTTTANTSDSTRDSRRRKSQMKPGTMTAALQANGSSQPWLAIVILGLSGFASLVHEIAWTRILALVLGPTTYAFAATLAAVVAGVAIGSGAGAWFAGRMKSGTHAGGLALVLAVGAITIVVTSTLAGSYVPRIVAHAIAASPDSFGTLLRQGMLLTALLILPTAICLGAAFPLALVDGRRSLGLGRAPVWPRVCRQHDRRRVRHACRRLRADSVAWPADHARCRRFRAGPRHGRRHRPRRREPWHTQLQLRGRRPRRAGHRLRSAVGPRTPGKRRLPLRALRAEGARPRDAVEGRHAAVLQGRCAGHGLREALTGTTTLAVDGKTDASNRSDMLTQKLVAHLPLLSIPPRATSPSSGSGAA